MTKLKAPKGATQTDVGANIDKAGKVYATYASSMVKMASSEGIVTGAATISGGKLETFTVPCSYKGKTYSVTERVDDTAKCSGHFIAKMTIGPELKGPTSTRSGFYDASTSKAT